MGKTFNKITKGIAKAAGANELVDYTASKIAKYHLRGKASQKFVEDKTTKKQAVKSALRLTANVASIAAAGAGMGTRAVLKKGLDKELRAARAVNSKNVVNGRKWNGWR